MKKLLFILTLLISFNVNAATCTLLNETIIDNCIQSDANANVLISWINATEYTDNKPIPLSEIKGTKIYFHRLVDNHWPPTITYDNTTTAAYVYMSPGEYEIFGTTMLINNSESSPSNIVPKTIIENPLSAKPPIISVPNIGTLIINLSG